MSATSTTSTTIKTSTSSKTSTPIKTSVTSKTSTTTDAPAALRQPRPQNPKKNSTSTATTIASAKPAQAALEATGTERNAPWAKVPRGSAPMPPFKPSLAAKPQGAAAASPSSSTAGGEAGEAGEAQHTPSSGVAGSGGGAAAGQGMVLGSTPVDGTPSAALGIKKAAVDAFHLRFYGSAAAVAAASASAAAAAVSSRQPAPADDIDSAEEGSEADGGVKQPAVDGGAAGAGAGAGANAGVESEAEADADADAEAEAEPRLTAEQVAEKTAARKGLALDMCLSSIGMGSKRHCSLHIARRMPKAAELRKNSDARGQLVLVRCTSANTKDEFLLEHNIEKVFARFRSDGKATIRLKVPKIDLLINKAKPANLTDFLEKLWKVHTDPESVYAPGTSMLMLNPLSKTKIIGAMQTKMTFNSGDTDVSELQFPPGLKWLVVNNCDTFVHVPARVLKLRALTTLDLSNNAIETVPPEISKIVTLTSINLSQNNLKAIPAGICMPSVQKLDLSHNLITRVSKRLFRMKALETLILCHNEVAVLPVYIYHLKNLRRFKVTHNKLTHLPAEITHGTRQRFQLLDVSGNPFAYDAPGLPLRAAGAAAMLRVTLSQPKSLFELAAFAVLRSRQPYKDELPDHLVQVLDGAGRCSKCRKAFVGDAEEAVTQFDLASLTVGGLHVLLPSGSHVPLTHRLCSDSCKHLLSVQGN